MKYILQFGKIHLSIWTNTFVNLDKYILQSEQIYFDWTLIHMSQHDDHLGGAE